MKTKNRSLLSRMCKCYSKTPDSCARVQQNEEEESSTGLTVFDEVFFFRVLSTGGERSFRRERRLCCANVDGSNVYVFGRVCVRF